MNHVHLGTKNLAALQDFYARYFGFEKKFTSGNTVFLMDKNRFLIAVDPVDELPVLPEWYHLGFCLDDKEQAFAIYEQMKKGGANIVRDMLTKEGAFASFFVKDPDGNKLEVSWHNE